MNKNQQRRVQETHPYYNKAEKYMAPIPVETGKALKYDMMELRMRAAKHTEWYQEQDEPDERGEEGRLKRTTPGNVIPRMERIQGGN